MASLNPMLLTVATLALLTFNLLHAAPTAKVDKRLLSPLAPVTSTINGVSIILENDVDSSTAKHSSLLLSQPRGYNDGMNSCLTMGEGGYIYISGTAGATSLITLLNSNAAAQQEVSGHSQFRVYNGIPGTRSNCLAVNKDTGKMDRISCSTKLPTICFNSVARRTLFSQDTSRQIKLGTPVGQVQGWRDQNSFRFLASHTRKHLLENVDSRNL